MTTLIDPQNHATLWALIAGGVAASIWLEQRYRWAGRLSAPVLALILAMVLSNSRIMPADAPVYGLVEKWLVPLAIPLLLARANLRQILRSGRGLLLAFHLATVGTLVGTALAVVALRPWIPSPGLEQAAALMAASYIGGGVNFFAVKASYDIPESISGPLLVADNFVMAGFFVALLGIAASGWFRRHYPHPHIHDFEGGIGGTAATEHRQREAVSVFDIARAFAFAFAVVAAAFAAEQALKTSFGDISDEGIGWKVLATLCTNRFVLLTTFSLFLATVLSRPLARVNGMDEFGSWMLLLFLFVIGLPADLWMVLSQAPLFFVFCAIIAVVNVAFTLATGKLCRLNLEELLLSMNATLGGAPSAAAMASGAGWSRLVLPGVLLGLWGYIIGTPIGIAIMEFLRP